MRDLFLEDGADMLQEPEVRRPDAADEIRDALIGRHVCPFCGMVKDRAEAPCPRCTMENTASTRQATKVRIGPWYVLQNRNPAAPGMKFETLLAFVRKGKVRARSIVRGPTTHQLWRFAAHVRGLSREFGICYSCGGEIDRTANLCPHCNRLQEPPPNPDVFLESPEHESGASPIYRQVGNEPPLVGQDMDARARAARAAEEHSRPSTAATPQPRRGGDGFLSPQDLAAAFKLDFKPKRGRGNAGGSTQQDAARGRSRGRRHRRRWKRWVALLVLLAGGGAFAFQYQRDPNFRAQMLVYYQRANTGVRHAIAWIQEKANQAAHPAPATDVSKPQVISAPQPHAQPQASSPATTQSSPWDQILKPANNDTTGTSATTQPAQPQSPVSDGAPEAQPSLDEARSLYRSAIDDEDKGDLKSAVKKYEQIHKFPHDLWPLDLELRLREARERLR